MTAGTVPAGPAVHVFDCATTPLYLWLRDAAVLAMWAFGEGVSDAEVTARRVEVALQVCEDLPSA